MRIAIISDSHGNLSALDAVLADLDRTGPYDDVLVGGDVAYGGPFPEGCVARIQERGYRTVRGNTEQMIDDVADAHARWVIDRLDESQLQFIRDLPVRETVQAGGVQVTLVHATPWSIYDSVRPGDGDGAFQRMLDEAGTRFVAYGHIHLQHKRELDDGAVIAVGSLGLPFDGDQRAMYTVIELSDDGAEVEFRRLAYDVEKAIAEARASDGPNCVGFAVNLSTAQRPG